MDDERQNTILIVDDEAMCINFLLLLLQNEFTILVAKDGKTAIEIAKTHLPDLILLDVDMPDMSGYEVLATLKTFDETKAIPAIFITSRERSTDEENGLRLGAVDYISKSSGADIIKMRIRNQMHMINDMRNTFIRM